MARVSGRRFRLCLPMFLTVAGLYAVVYHHTRIFVFNGSSACASILHAVFRGTTRQLTIAAPLRTRNVSHSRRSTGRSLNTKRISLSQRTTLASAYGSPGHYTT